MKILLLDLKALYREIKEEARRSEFRANSQNPTQEACSSRSDK